MVKVTKQKREPKAPVADEHHTDRRYKGTKVKHPDYFGKKMRMEVSNALRKSNGRSLASLSKPKKIYRAYPKQRKKANKAAASMGLQNGDVIYNRRATRRH